MEHKAVSLERWNEAQTAERTMHKMGIQEGIRHYSISYGHNFRYLNIDPYTVQVGICEIGCADFPALAYVARGPGCLIVEPMPSKHLREFCEANRIKLITEPFETLAVPEYNPSEIWMFNVLQHVQDPEKFIAKAKQAKRIRYFEPIDTGTAPYHPHSFTKDDFDRWFPGVNKYYNESTNACFHDGPCCYGVWENRKQ